MKCPYINPTVSQCLTCSFEECDGGKSKDTKEKQKRHYYRHLEKMRNYHRCYQKSKYNTEVNTEKCKKYREKNIEQKRKYDHERYERLKRERQAV